MGPSIYPVRPRLLTRPILITGHDHTWHARKRDSQVVHKNNPPALGFQDRGDPDPSPPPFVLRDIFFSFLRPNPNRFLSFLARAHLAWWLARLAHVAGAVRSRTASERSALIKKGGTPLNPSRHTPSLLPLPPLATLPCVHFLRGVMCVRDTMPTSHTQSKKKKETTRKTKKRETNRDERDKSCDEVDTSASRADHGARSRHRLTTVWWLCFRLHGAHPLYRHLSTMPAQEVENYICAHLFLVTVFVVVVVNFFFSPRVGWGQGRASFFGKIWS